MLMYRVREVARLSFSLSLSIHARIFDPLARRGGRGGPKGGGGRRRRRRRRHQKDYNAPFLLPHSLVAHGYYKSMESYGRGRVLS